MSHSHHVRLLSPLAGGAAAVTGWMILGRLAGAAGLVLLLAAAVTVWPLLVIAVFFLFPSLLAGLLVPRRWRAAYRHGRGRPAIHAWLRRAVFAADRYRCVYCGSQLSLQVDHIRPWASGGLSSLLNCMTLCAVHNRVKSNYWIDRDGYVHYRGFDGSESRRLAAAILAAERRRRWNPVRWIRAAWALS